jgi:hypothetical protein
MWSLDLGRFANARFCTPLRALFRAFVPQRGELRFVLLMKVFELIGFYGGRTRDRTLDLSRVKGTLSR